MFTIRQGQMDAFESNARARFITQIADDLKDEMTDHRRHVPDEVVREEVEKMVVIAEGFGLKAFDNITMFLNVASDIGHDFYDVFDAAHDVLSSTILDEDFKSIWLAQWYAAMLTPEGGWPEEDDEEKSADADGGELAESHT